MRFVNSLWIFLFFSIGALASEGSCANKPTVRRGLSKSATEPLIAIPRQRQRSPSVERQTDSEKVSKEFIPLKKMCKDNVNRKQGRKNVDLRRRILRKAVEKERRKMMYQELKKKALIIAKFYKDPKLINAFTDNAIRLILRKYYTVGRLSRINDRDYVKLLAFAMLADVIEVFGPIYEGNARDQDRIFPMYEEPGEQLEYLKDLALRVSNAIKE